MSSLPTPTDITLKKASRELIVSFADGQVFRLPCEYLRVYSPSAEVRGHGEGMKLVPGKREVNITAVEPVGRYAVRLRFDDGHNTGLYSWDVLHDLGVNQPAYWADYLARLEAAGESREPKPVRQFKIREARLGK